MALLKVEVPQYAHQSGSYFGLLRGYVESCPHASVHLSNMSGTRRLLSFLVMPDGEHLAIDTAPQPSASASPGEDAVSSAGPLFIEVPNVTFAPRDTGFPSWVRL